MNPEVLFPIAFVLIVVAALLGAHVMEKKRRAAMEQAAGSLGLTFDGDGGGLMSRLTGIARLFDQGRRRKVKNLMTGQIEDLGLHVFDYAYTTGSGKNSSTWRQTVVGIEMTASGLPRFELRPERFYHKIGAAMGYQDIDLPEHPAFSRVYLLRGNDEEAIRSVMTDEVVQHIGGAKSICVESASGWLFVYRARKRVKPAELSQFVDEAFAICNRLL